MAERTRPSVEHPCLSCRLPDCDDRHPKCALRRALALYHSHIRNRVPVPPEVRARNTIAYYEIYGDMHRARSSDEKERVRKAREAERAIERKGSRRRRRLHKETGEMANA